LKLMFLSLTPCGRGIKGEGGRLYEGTSEGKVQENLLL
jgi:hypothetical protein